MPLNDRTNYQNIVTESSEDNKNPDREKRVQEHQYSKAQCEAYSPPNEESELIIIPNTVQFPPTKEKYMYEFKLQQDIANFRNSVLVVAKLTRVENCLKGD